METSLKTAQKLPINNAQRLRQASVPEELLVAWQIKRSFNETNSSCNETFIIVENHSCKIIKTI